jgi:hypothetical protein
MASMTTGEFLAHHEAIGDAIAKAIRGSIANCPWDGRVVQDIEGWLAWTREQLATLGMTAAAKHCNRHDLAEYACWVARAMMDRADPGYVEFCTPSILTGEDEVTFWRAVTIACEMKKIRY